MKNLLIFTCFNFIATSAFAQLTPILDDSGALARHGIMSISGDGSTLFAESGAGSIDRYSATSGFLETSLVGDASFRFDTFLHSINTDGTKLVVSRQPASPTPGFTAEAFLFSTETGLQQLETPAGFSSAYVFSLSDNGNYAGGSLTNGLSDSPAVRWDLTNNTSDVIGILPGTPQNSLGFGFGGREADANSLSNSGVVVGTSTAAGANESSFIWDPTNGLRELARLPLAEKLYGSLPTTPYFGEAHAISQDGSTIVGAAGALATVWKSADITQVQAVLHGALIDLTADGSVAVGTQIAPSKTVADLRAAYGSNGGLPAGLDPLLSAFEAGETEIAPVLEFLNQQASIPQDVARLFVDQADSMGLYYGNFQPQQNVAILWTGEKAITVKSWLEASGVAVGSIAQYEFATGISEDGTIVLIADLTDSSGAPLAISDRSFAIARAESLAESAQQSASNPNAMSPGLNGITPGFGLLSLNEDLARSLSSSTAFGATLSSFSNLTINGAHHRLLMDNSVGENGWHTWATGDFGNHGELNYDIQSGELGASRNIGDENVRFGVGFGRTLIDQDLPFSGEASIDGNYILAEANYRIPDTSLIFSGLLYAGDFDANVRRGYLNAGLSDSSRGFTLGKSRSFRLRADWKNAARLGALSITPRVGWTYLDTKVDGYTETGGGFPVRFDAQTQKAHELRLGLDLDMDLNERADLRFIAEAVQRFDQETNVSGSIVGITPFSFRNEDLSSLWGRIGVEFSYEVFEDQVLRGAIFGSTEGSDPSISGAINYNIGF